MSETFHSDSERDTAERDEVARKNKQALLELLYEHKQLYIPVAGFDEWRPTVREIGEVAGLWPRVEIIATNGFLAWFLNHDPEKFGEVLFGHIQCFSGEVRTLYSCQKDEKPIKEKGLAKPKGQTLLQRAMEFLTKSHESLTE